MKIKVNPHNVEIIKEQTEPINEKEIKISKCQFEFSDEITNDFVKEAYFTLNGETYKQIIYNNECEYPNEVLTQSGTLEIGVVAYLVEDETEIKRYNPSPDYYETWVGSLKDAENTEPITPTDKEQMEQAIQDMETKVDNLDIDAEKVDKTTTITITKKDGTQEEVEILDGIGLNYNWLDTSLGIKREDEQEYQYVNLKGDKGDAGAIKMIIVAELPETGQEDTIYLVPLETPESQENRYAEYVYINGEWELLGKIGIEVDLTDYYTKTETNSLLDTKVGFTDYATSQTGGVFKTGNNLSLGSSSGVVNCNARTYAQYSSDGNNAFISKGTLENVITGKDLTTKAYVDSLVGDIQTLLDNLNTGSGV